MDFCNPCLRLTQWITKPTIGNFSRWDTEKKPTYRQTGITCRICQVILNNLQLPISKDVPLRLSFVKWSSCMRSDQDLCCMVHVSYEIEDDQVPLEQRRFAIWADEGSPASEACVTRSPILIERLKDICNLTQSWLSECSLHHVDCFATEEVRLPTRVLEISGTPEAPSVKLLETNGIRGCYCALSHCWGPPDKQPLTTTHANLQHHLIGIPLEQLPKTFRDTLMLAQGIGIKFVWIDSLCIIQGDTQDWHSEAKDMGQTYRNATLVIAAAGSRDSKEGLFVTQRPQSASVRLPYFLDGVIEGSFNIALLSQHKKDPIKGPLSERAWAFQEWYLARRILFFMPGGITWKCNELESSEPGCHEDLLLDERTSWLHLLESYSEKKLTYHSDRLHALRGIVAEMQKTRQDQFLLEYGVWEDRILEQILWRRAVLDSEDNLLALPTWSWAATGDAKVWCVARYDEKVQYLPKVVGLTSSGSLSISGHMLRLTWALSCFSSHAFVRFEATYIFEMSMTPGFCGNKDSPAYIIWDDTSDDIILGIAVFDREPVFHAQCFLAASTERDLDQPFHSEASLYDSQRSEPSEADEELNISDPYDGPHVFDMETRPSSIKSSTSSNDIETSRDVDTADDNKDSKMVDANDFPDSEYSEDIETSQVLSSASNEEDSLMLEIADLDSQHDSDMFGDIGKDNDWIKSNLAHLADTTSHVYWALLLEPIGEAKFKRVGLAMLYPHAYKESSKEFVQFEIV